MPGFIPGIFYGCKRQSSIPLKKTARAGVVLLYEKEGIGVQPLSQQKTPTKKKDGGLKTSATERLYLFQFQIIDFPFPIFKI